MLQIRPKDGDRRWYDADRDLVYALPRVVRTVLDTLEPTAVNLEFAKHLGSLFVHCRACDVSLDDIKIMSATLRRDYPLVYDEVAQGVFSVLLGEMRWGCGNVSSKGSVDPVVNLFGLDNIGQIMLTRPRRWWQIWRSA